MADSPGSPTPSHPLPDGSSDNGRTLVGVETSLSWSGPLPPPKVLEAYDRLVPGAAERIMKMAEQQSEHRRGLEKTVVEAGARD